MKRVLKLAFAVLVILYIGVVCYHQVKPLPSGLDYLSEEYYVSARDVSFIADYNYEIGGRQRVEQSIFNEVLNMIDSASDYIVLDMFLFNTEGGSLDDLPDVTGVLTDALVEKRSNDPSVDIIFITDPINSFYGSYASPELIRLEEAGVEVVVTDLDKLRDSNGIYSGFYRMFLGWFGTSGSGWIPNLFGTPDRSVTLRAVLKLLNTKANHRKVIVADDRALVTSWNPHTGSGLHSNVALVVNNSIVGDVLASEYGVVLFSSYEGTFPSKSYDSLDKQNLSVQYATEKSIKDSLLDEIAATISGDAINIATFYFSDRDIVKALLDAVERDVEINIVLDPNKDAFGREKGGIPNRQVAYELVKKSDGKITLRWYDTDGEQFHTKMVVIRRGADVYFIIGSTNLTRRNLDNFNLESVVIVRTVRGFAIAEDVLGYFDRVFGNIDGEFTVGYHAYKDESLWKYWLYRFQERYGFSTF